MHYFYYIKVNLRDFDLLERAHPPHHLNHPNDSDSETATVQGSNQWALNCVLVQGIVRNLKTGMNRILVSFFSLLIAVMACDSVEDVNPAECDQEVLIGEEEYNNAPNDILDINSVTINGDCLTINFSSSGCDGSTWELKLVTSGGYDKTNPPRRHLRLSLKNEELCDAYFSKEMTFDIQELKVDGNSVILNITNSDDAIIYEY